MKLDAVRNELKKFKENRSSSHHNKDHLTSEDNKVYIYFQTPEGSKFTIPIEEVKEIASYVTPKVYPCAVEGHHGVLNLRGNVIPLVSISKKQSTFDPNTARLLILYGENEQEFFALIVTQVKKTQLNALSEGKIMNVEGEPVRFITSSEMGALIRGSDAS